MHAIDLANALAEFEPYWFEEARQSENVEALAELRTKGRRRPGLHIPVTRRTDRGEDALSASMPAASIAQMKKHATGSKVHWWFGSSSILHQAVSQYPVRSAP
jgi:hypothetical protein